MRDDADGDKFSPQPGTLGGHVILVRHGSTKLNAGGVSVERIRGWSDIDLDKRGQKEAAEIAARLASDNPRMVYASDLRRTKETGMMVARAAHAPIVFTDKLRPWNLGIMTGKEVHKVLPVMNKLVEHPDVPVPDGESFDDFRMRYLPFLKQQIEESRLYHRPTVLVAHSRNVQLARAWDKAGRPEDFTYNLPRMQDYRDEIPPGGEIRLK